MTVSQIVGESLSNVLDHQWTPREVMERRCSEVKFPYLLSLILVAFSVVCSPGRQLQDSNKRLYQSGIMSNHSINKTLTILNKLEQKCWLNSKDAQKQELTPSAQVVKTLLR